MTPGLSAIASAALAVVVGVCGYFTGQSIGKFEGRLEGFKRGAKTGTDAASAIARHWANRREWPLDNRANVQRWKELGRREAVASCANELCRAFNIETPTRTVTND